MIRKLFWSLLALLASLFSVLGVVRWDWSWQMFVPAGATLVFLLIAARAGTSPGWTHIPEEEGHEDLDPAVTRETGISPPRQKRHTTRLEWGETLPELSSCTGPTEF